MKRYLALGFFDCIHIGHRFLLEQGKKEAERLNAKFCVTTFNDDFPAYFRKKSEEIFLLNERKSILSEMKMDNVIVFPSDSTFFRKSKEDFCEYLLQFDPVGLISGEDYRFGNNSEGDISFLKKFFTSKGVKVTVCDLIMDNGEKVSTNSIKNLLKIGCIEEANRLLSTDFYYEGIVRDGRKDGQKIGVPTLNIDVCKEKIKIKSGVYLTKTIVKDNIFPSVTNVGSHPTFNDDGFNVETHVPNVDLGVMYGEKIRIIFQKYIREIRRFKDKVELAEQIKKDIAYTEEIK